MKKHILTILAILLLSVGTLAAKQDVVLIHGYGNFFSNTSWGSETLSKIYWAYWENKAFQNVSVKHIPWDSTRRVDGQIADIVNRFNQHIDEGHCSDGCVVYTHSTGGLVIDMLLSRAIESKGTSNDFSRIADAVTVAIPIASAGGGVNFAVYAGDFVVGACNVPLFGSVLTGALNTVFPFIKCNNVDSLGAGYDLRPSVARSVNGSNNTRTMSLMIAGNGNMVGNIIKPFLVGTSDGLVAMHSACGASNFESYESCVPSMGPEGKLASFTAPTSFYNNHKPYIMTKEGHGSELMPGLVNLDLLSTKTEVLIDNYGVSNIQTQTKRGGFLWLTKYKTIQNDERHLSKIIGDHFNYDL
ncbi:MAG: hypothetical protein ACI86H_001890 [bacterium]|jgi:hypothetical protein